MTIDDPATTARTLRDQASTSLGTAAVARDLARDIDRRRRVLAGRLEGCVARHTDEVWRSAAAARSRTELRRGVGFAVWAADRALLETRCELDARADDLEQTARRQCRRADELEAEAARSGVS